MVLSGLGPFSRRELILNLADKEGAHVDANISQRYRQVLESQFVPRRSRKMTHVCSLKVTRIESTSMHTDLNLFLHCERQRSCLLYLLDERVDTL